MQCLSQTIMRVAVCVGRCDPEKKRYTGALCGLGFDSIIDDPIFKDHDIEVDFDFTFAEQDLELVCNMLCNGTGNT